MPTQILDHWQCSSAGVGVQQQGSLQKLAGISCDHIATCLCCRHSLPEAQQSRTDRSAAWPGRAGRSRRRPRCCCRPHSRLSWRHCCCLHHRPVRSSCAPEAVFSLHSMPRCCAPLEGLQHLACSGGRIWRGPNSPSGHKTWCRDQRAAKSGAGSSSRALEQPRGRASAILFQQRKARLGQHPVFGKAWSAL